MDYDKGLVSALLREGTASVREIRKKLPSVQLLTGDGKHAYDFIVDFTSRFGEAPTFKLVQQHTGIDLDPDPLASNDELAAPSLWWLEKLTERKLHEDLYSMGEVLAEQLVSGNANAALEMLEKGIKGLRRDLLTRDTGVEGIGHLSAEVRDYYQELKAGKRGILTPWQGINDATLGFWPQDLALFVARAGVGKTWTAILLALKAWEDGKKVLFATTEISRMRIAMRLMAIKYKLNYNDFRKGQLGDNYDKFLDDKVDELLADENFFVAGGNFDFRVEHFAAEVEERCPDLVILDGAYLLRVEGKTRTERAANAFDEVKRIANSTGVPIVCTMQFNRQAKSNMSSTADLANIGLTDVAGWNADSAYALQQTDDQKVDGIMEFKPMKVREGFGEVVTVRWDLNNMIFDQIAVGEGNKEVSDATESDAPFDPSTFKPDGGDDDEGLPF